MQLWNIKTVEVSNARDALIKIDNSVHKNNPFQIIITDVQMPEMDGFELTKKIRSNTYLEGVKIIIISSMSQKGDAERCKIIGADGFLKKPLRQ